jgi:hypothetical protein
MGASKEFPITDHEFIPCGCSDPDCKYCAECLEQESFHQPAAPLGPRDVSLDEVFTWKENFFIRAQEAFGGPICDVSPQTYSDLKVRCDKLDREIDPFFEHVRSLQPSPPPGAVTVHMVKPGEVPDGVLRACTCGTRKQI